MLGERPYTFDRVFRLAATAGLLYSAILTVGYLSDVLFPFAVAFLLAYLLNPLVVKVQKRIGNRPLAVFATLAAIAAVLAIAGCFLVPMIMREIAHMGKLLGRLASDAELARRAAEKLPPNLWESIREYMTKQQFMELVRQKDFWSLAQSTVGKVLPGVWGLVAGTTNFLLGVVGLLVILLYLVFLLLDYQKVKRDWQQMIPEFYRESIVEFLQEFDSQMSRYFRAQAVVAGTVGLLFAFGFTLIGLPMGILLGLLVGLLNMVPYLQIVGLIPASVLAIIMALETGGSVPTIVGLTVAVFAVVQVLQDTLITPRIMGKATGLSPAMILLSISIWGKLLGFLGLVIALPMTCLVSAYYRRMLAEPPK
ncbi:MAG: AI-2E family transporter [Elusimicrobiota bacterium]